MIRHIVAWNFQDGFSPAQQLELGQQAARRLEALKESIPGIVGLKLHLNGLDTGNRELLLDSVFESAEALAGYQIHPEHVEASKFIGTFVRDRVCFDCEI